MQQIRRVSATNRITPAGLFPYHCHGGFRDSSASVVLQVTTLVGFNGGFVSVEWAKSPT